MSKIITSARPKNTLESIREAVAWVRRLGLFVRPSVAGHGVACVSSLSDIPWAVSTEAGSIDPIGACILRDQPINQEAGLAAAEVLGGSVAYAECLACGLAGEDMPAEWRSSAAVILAFAGWVDGSNLRDELLERNAEPGDEVTADVPPAVLAEAMATPEPIVEERTERITAHTVLCKCKNMVPTVDVISGTHTCGVAMASKGSA